MQARTRAARGRGSLAAGPATAVLASLASACVAVTASHAASLELSASGELAIDGRAVTCKPSIQTILDARLPNLGIATRTQLVLNPHLLRRLSPTVRMFVYHHECGHHHVGGDEFGADCWAVKAGVAAGWLNRPQLAEICTSFGNSGPTATHPATSQRCRALHACFAAATRRAPPQTTASTGTPPPSTSTPSPHLVHEGFAAPISPER
jgi:hypothetical protein